MAKFEFVQWLLSWLLENRDYSFEWDSGNKNKSKTKHGLETYEIEEIFKTGLAIPLGVQISPPVDEERLGIVGPTLDGKLIHVVFTLRDGRIRPISARRAQKKERTQYGEILRKISEGV